VTKPCRPICYEFMAVLRGGAQDQFMIRRGHSTVYPLELPPWVPQSVCEQMVDKFRKHLNTQLDLMVSTHEQAASGLGLSESLSKMVGYAKGHRHTPSNLSMIESDSGLSTVTSASDHSKDLATSVPEKTYSNWVLANTTSSS
jgi:hypothetical protein